MRWTQSHNHWFAQCLVKSFEESPAVQSLKSGKNLIGRISALLDQELEREKHLEEEVRRTLDDLENSHGGRFDRQKMYSMLKSKLAEKKGIIL